MSDQPLHGAFDAIYTQFKVYVGDSTFRVAVPILGDPAVALHDDCLPTSQQEEIQTLKDKISLLYSDLQSERLDHEEQLESLRKQNQQLAQLHEDAARRAAQLELEVARYARMDNERVLAGSRRNRALPDDSMGRGPLKAQPVERKPEALLDSATKAASDDARRRYAADSLLSEDASDQLLRDLDRSIASLREHGDELLHKYAQQSEVTAGQYALQDSEDEQSYNQGWDSEGEQQAAALSAPASDGRSEAFGSRARAAAAAAAAGSQSAGFAPTQRGAEPNLPPSSSSQLHSSHRSVASRAGAGREEQQGLASRHRRRDASRADASRGAGGAHVPAGEHYHYGGARAGARAGGSGSEHAGRGGPRSGRTAARHRGGQPSQSKGMGSSRDQRGSAPEGAGGGEHDGEQEPGEADGVGLEDATRFFETLQKTVSSDQLGELMGVLARFNAGEVTQREVMRRATAIIGNKGGVLDAFENFLLGE